MATLNSKIILASGIKLDKSYKNVVDYTESQMLELVNNKKITDANNYSFIKHGKNEIEVGFSYSTCLQANYIAFQNPDYSNKWFFAFIDDIEYRANATTRIKFTIDYFATWFDYWNPSRCFVIREHVSNDTIGLHTYPEQLETGEYTNHDDKTKFGIGSCHAVVCTTEDPFASPNYPNNIINSVPSGLHYFVVGDFTSVNFIGWLTDWAVKKSDVSLINSIFIVPDSMTGYAQEGDLNYWSFALSENGMNYAPYHKLPSRLIGSINMGDTNISKPYNNIDGYTPKNNKLFCYPYNFMVVDNNGGSAYEYKYEDFTSQNCVFSTKGAITPGCSIKTIPRNYKHIDYNYEESLNALKLPVGSWSSDVYTNWLTQNGVNIGISLLNAGISAIGGAGMIATGGGAVAGVTALTGAGISVAQTLNEIYQHSRIPNQVSGNTNSGDVTYADGESVFTIYRRTIKSEYARMIDDYFDKFGYKINRLKIPNQNTRPYWNYVQIDMNDNIAYGNIPIDAMEIINTIYRNGVTIWHNHENIGNYSLNNH